MTHLDNLPAILTRQEVALLLRITDRSVDQMCRDGRLSSFKIGSNRRFHRDEILGLIPPPRRPTTFGRAAAE
jgi:excisionase family DNA binding protein